jgi:hypothetical protein
VFPTVIATIGLLIFATNGLAENKVDKDVAYGTHQRHVLDMVCYGKGEPKGGDVIEVGNKNDN